MTQGKNYELNLILKTSLTYTEFPAVWSQLHMQFFTRDGHAISRNYYIAITHTNFCV